VRAQVPPAQAFFARQPEYTMAGVIAYLQSTALHHERVGLPPARAPYAHVAAPAAVRPCVPARAYVRACARRCRKRRIGGASAET